MEVVMKKADIPNGRGRRQDRAHIDRAHIDEVNRRLTEGGKFTALMEDVS
jgi:hypothetical protein